jgi:lysylphosphatidylglycerol synthetase-like protein (DUF2156 family)
MQASVRQLPSPIGAATRSALTVVVVSGAWLSWQTWLTRSHSWHSAGAAAAAWLGPAGVIVGLALLGIVVAVVLRPKRTLRDALLATAAATSLLALIADHQGLALLGVLALAGILAVRSLWPEVSDPVASRGGRDLVLGAVTLVTALFVIGPPKGVLVGGAALLLIAALGIGTWGLVLLGRNAAIPMEGSLGPARAVYNRHAQSGVSPFALMADKRHFWSADGKAFLAYTDRAGVALVLGPAIGPAESVANLYAEFESASHLRGWRIAYYQVPSSLTESLGWKQRYRIGSEAIVDLESLTLEGPAMAKLRHEVSRARRHGVRVSILPAGFLEPATKRAMDELAHASAGRGWLGEMAFSVGSRTDRPAVETMAGLAHDRQGRLVGYTTWLRLPAAHGIILDEMRRRPDAPPGAMHLLVYRGLQVAGERASWASLGMAPVAGAAEVSALARMEEWLLERLGISVARSLFAFKEKFVPRWEPRYLTTKRLSDWPAVGLATLMAHYPKLSAARRPWPSPADARAVA